MSKKIKGLYQKAGLKAPNGKGIHTEAFHRCVVAVTKKGKAKNPHAVCMSMLTPLKAVKKSHRRS